MNAKLEEQLPILEVASDAMVSKMGDVTIALELDKPEIFTLGVQEYEALHQAYVKALKVLPEGTVVHFQDIFTKREYEGGVLRDGAGMLREASERFFNGRPRLEHRARIFLTRRPVGRRAVTSLTSALLRKIIVPAETLSPAAFQEFEDVASQFSRILEDTGLMRVRRIPGTKLASSEGKNAGGGKDGGASSAGVIEQYCCLLDDDERPVIRDIDLGPQLRVGGMDCVLYTLADAAHLPVHSGPAVAYEKFSAEQSRLPVGFGAGMGLLLDCNHIYNQYIVIGDQQVTVKKLESKRLRLQSLARYSRENAVAQEATNAFLNELVSQQRVACRAHFNILAWTDKPDELKEIRNKIGSAMAGIDAVAHQETIGAPQLWWAGIPGNAGELPENECFDTFLEQACCFLSMETNYRSSASEFGLRFGDRLTGYPVNVDIDIEPRRLGLTQNGNLFVLSGSGGGKSFLMNHLCRSYFDQGMHIVIVDVGHSYQVLCELLGGYYFTYEEARPIRFNPFYIGSDEVFDTEKKESLKSLLLALWKKSDEAHYRSEYVALSNAVQAYYDWLRDGRQPGGDKYAGDGMFPCFDSFYEFVERDYVALLREQDVKEKEFDVSNFLYVLRPYYRGGEFDYLLNAQDNLDLLGERFIVFELDNIKDHPILFPVVTLVIMEVFLSKMRRLRGVRKMIVIEEAWKAIANAGMAENIRYWVKTLRKFMGKLALVSQEVDDIIGSPIVRQAIINNSDCKILLDQSKFQNRFDEIQALLGISDKQKAEILSINRGHVAGRPYKDLWVCLGPSHSKVYRLEVSPEEYLAYTSDQGEKVKIEAAAKEAGSLAKGIEVLADKMKGMRGMAGRMKGMALGLVALLVSSGVQAQIPIVSIISQLAQKVVVAIDLGVQKKQLETLELQSAEQDAQNSMEESELSDIGGWLQKQKDLYSEYYNELWQVKNAISGFERVKQMISEEAEIVRQFQTMSSVLGSDKHFTAAEVETMKNILNGILTESVHNIQKIELVINALVTQMADADRLRIIDGAGSAIDKNFSDMQQFYERNMLLSLERARGQNDIQATKALYGL